MKARGIEPPPLPTRKTKDNQRLVGIREFIDSSDYLDMKREVWPGVKDDLEAMSCPGILGAIIEQGIGGGKSYRVSIKLLYDLYKLAFLEVCLGVNPRLQWDLDPQAMISVANVSLKQSQAKKVVFGYVSTFIDRSPWFKEYLPRDKRITSEVRFSLPYSVFPGHSHQSSVIGLNLYSCVIDEGNFFVKAETSGIDYVAEMWDAIESRIRSRFGLDGFLGLISSRRTINDFTARKKRSLLTDKEAATRYHLPPSRAAWLDWPEEKKRTLRSGGPCRWREFSPHTYILSDTKQRYEEIEDKPGMWVPETLWDTFTTNPESAMRDHASVPSEALSPFIRRKDKIEPAWGDEDNVPLESPVLPHVKPHMWCQPGIRFEDLIADWFYGDAEEVYHFHVDLAATRDACGLAIARNSGVCAIAKSNTDSRKEKAPFVDVEAIICIKAPPKGEIDFSLIRRLLYWLREERGFKFRRSSYDGWQSRDSQQILKRKGFVVEELSVDRNKEAYTNLKEALYDGRLFFPPAHGQTQETPWEDVVGMAEKGDPCAIFQVELARLEDINDKKVDHPANGSKDLSDAVAGAVTQAIRMVRLGRETQ